MKKYFLFSVVLLMFYSCAKEELIPVGETTNSENSSVDAEKITAVTLQANERVLYDFARVYAKALNSKRSVQAFTQTKLGEEWGGDYQMLYKNIKGKYVEGKTSLESALAVTSSDQSILEEANRIQDLRILAPEKSYELITKNGITANTLVLVEPEEDDARTISGYNLRGDFVTINMGEEAPDFPVIVIGYCEICDDRGAILDEFQDANTINAARTHGDEETVTYIKCPDMGAIECWAKGKPELRFVGVVYLTYANNVSKAFDFITQPNRGDAKDGYDTNLGLFNWYFNSSHGDDYYIQTFEQDRSKKNRELEVTVSNNDFEIGYNKKDEILYGRLINKNESDPKLYSSSNVIHFRLENK